MIPWIQVYSNILTHDKTYSLAEALKVPNYSAVGLMVSLWCWVAVNAPDGDITRYPPRAITEATGWTKKPETFYNALVNAGLIEKTEDGRAVIRNWEQYAMLLIDLMSSQKKKTAERVKKHRERKKQREQAGDDPAPQEETPPVTPEPEEAKQGCNVTETESNALHNITLHNPTGHNPSPNGEDINSFVVDDDGPAARAKKIIDDYVDERDLRIESFFGQNEQTMAEIREITEQIFKKFSLRRPTDNDVAQVFFHVKHQDRLQTGEWALSFDDDALKLLMYCFEQASNASCPGNWNYINGCMAKLAQRGIRTLQQAEDYDWEREKA